ncbi:FUSC family protein [Mariniflexile ostreae]|uniref:FUSC family protein n=1 Tax=Mariniflexile ostreae TaxID=1520892 RepID=A0ABV5FBG4_9FLAO
MKQLFTVLAAIASFLAIILSVLPASNLAVIPAVVALVFGGLAYFLSKRSGQINKTIPFTLFLTMMALVITLYKAAFNNSEIGNTKELIRKEEASKEEAIDELENLDLDFEDIPGE